MYLILKNFLLIFALTLTLHAESAKGIESITLDKLEESMEIPDKSIGYYFQDIAEKDIFSQLGYTPNPKELIEMDRNGQKEWTANHLSKLFTHSYLNIDQVASQEFSSRTDTPPEFSPRFKYTWYKFQLRYDTPPENIEQFVFELGRYANRAFLFSQVGDGAITFQGYSGYDMIHGHDNWQSPENFIPVSIPPQTKEMTVFLAINTIRAHHNWNPTLTTESTFRSRTVRNLSFYMAFAGAALVILLYNLGVFLIARDKTYLYYSLSLMFYIPFFLEASLGRLTPWSSVGFLNKGPFIATIFFWMTCMFLFTRHALNLAKYKYLNWFYIGMFTVNLVTGLAVYEYQTLGIPLGLVYKANMYSTMSGISIFFLTTLFLVFKRERVALIYMSATIVWMAGLWLTFSAITGAVKMNLLTYNAQHMGLLVFMVVWSIAMGDKLRVLNLSLKKYIGKVEQLVEEKTAKISSIMKNIKLGIFTVSGNRSLGSEYTNHLEKILEQGELANQPVEKAFLDHLKLDSDTRSRIDSFLNATIGEDEISYEMNKHLAPTEIYLQKGSGKILEVEWGAVVQEGEIKSILVSIKDVTQQRYLEDEANAAKRELDIVASILDIDAEYFERFIESSYGFIEHNRDLINKNTTNISEVVKVLFINMHTIKGAARGYNFNHMTATIHDVEQSYAQLAKGEMEWDQAKLLSDLDDVEKLISEYETINREKLGRSKNTDKTEIDLSTLKELHSILSNESFQEFTKSHKGFDQSQKLLKRVQNLYYVSTESVLDEASKSLPSLAKDLGKELPKIDFQGEHVGLDREASNVLVNALVHIIRNSMDHGIEDPQAREVMGKQKAGTLSFNVTSNDDGLEIDYHDDGQGLNMDKIKSIGVQRGMLDKADETNDNKVAELVLESGFSTADKVTEVSGRGVGMDAVKTYLKDAGGDLVIDLRERNQTTGNRAFHLKIKLPQKHIAKAA